MRVERKPIADSRGFFTRLYCAEAFRAAGCKKAVAQINHTLTRVAGTVRGMHFQHRPHAEIKIVSCLRGEVFDVAVDLRGDSPTFLRWHAEALSADNHRTLVIPEGFAHGFQTLTDDCEMLYFHTAAYHAPAEGGLNPSDPRLAVHWPLPVEGVSPRDASHPMLDGTFTGLAS